MTEAARHQWALDQAYREVSLSDAPLSLSAAAPTNSGKVNGARGSLVPNAIHLGLASLVLCVLGLIVGEVSDSHGRGCLWRAWGKDWVSSTSHASSVYCPLGGLDQILQWSKLVLG